MSETDMVEILMATYNGEEYICSQLDSLLAQSFETWRVLIRDDGSTDRTPHLCRQYAMRHPSRFHIIEDALGNLGVNKNYETLLKSSTGDYVMFCDQDDIWLPDKITETYAKMRETETEVGVEIPILVYTDLNVVNRKLELISDSFFTYTHRKPTQEKCVAAMCMANCTIGCTMMMNEKFRSLFSGFPDTILMWDWWLSMMAVTMGRLVFLSKVTMLFRRHGRNESTVSKFGVRSYFKKRNSFKKSRERLFAIFRSHEVFYKTFNTLLSPAQCRFFEQMASIPSRNWVMRRYLLLKLRLFKTGFIKNAGMLLVI
jgi:glycosyltransferase involved in cell wall biosynthesis